MANFRKLLGLSLICAGFTGATAANQDHGIALANAAALSNGFGLPELGTVNRDQGFSISLALSSEYHSDIEDNERAIVDGENWSINARKAWSINERTSLFIKANLLVAGGGFLDSFIDDFHSATSLPDGNRPSAPRDRRLYRITRDQEVLLEASGSAAAITDVRIGAQYLPTNNFRLFTELLLPTGNENSFPGAASFAVSAGAQRNFVSGNLSGFLAGGASWNNGSETLLTLRRDWVGYMGAGVQFSVSPNWGLFTQVGANTGLYKDTKLRVLTDPGVVLAFGASYRAPSGTIHSVAFTEDPVAATSPDFGLSYQIRFKSRK